MSSPDLIRIVLVDDHTVVRAGLRAVLAGAKDMEIVGEGSSGDEAVSLAISKRPDVVVMDLTMDGMNGDVALREMRARGVEARVLILSMHAEEEYLVPLLEAGANGYLVKSTADRDLLDAIRAVARGDLYVRPAAARILARGLARKDPVEDEQARFERLTDREREVLRLTAQGYSAPEMGAKLSISPKTVDTYKQRIQEKLGLSHRSQYVKMALKLGILGDD
jgi:two-component system response regulator NreC